MRSLAKRLCSLTKPVEFGLFTSQLKVVHTALYVHNAAVIEGKKRLNVQGVAFIFCFINSNILNKVINVSLTPYISVESMDF